MPNLEKKSAQKLPRSLAGRLWVQTSAKISLILLGAMLFLIIFGAFFWRIQPNETNFANKNLAPSTQNPLGTDQFGRDQLARIINGGKRSLGAAILVLSFVVAVGLLVGLPLGLFGGIFDTIFMRFVDVWLSIPTLIIALAIVGLLGVGFGNLILALAISQTAYYIRLSRSYALNAKQRPDVLTAQLAGVSETKIIVGHILPSAFAQILIVATLDLGGVIIGLASLSFLGLGAQPPHAEWGAMLAEARLYFSIAPWLLIAPTLAIFLSVMATNLLGNALRNAFSNC